MDINPESKRLRVGTDEPFGRLLLDLMYSSSLDEKINKVQRHIGGLLVDAYIKSQFRDLSNLTVDNYRDVLDIDLAKDIADKSEDYARTNPVELVFEAEHIEGIKSISLKEVSDLENLKNERAAVAMALEFGYESGVCTYIRDEELVYMIEDEIKQVNSAKDVLDALNIMEESN